VDAYAALVRASEPAARRLSMLLCGADGDDAVQDAIVKGWYALDRYREEAPFRSWLLRIVANEARNRRRSAGRRAARELRSAELRHEPSAESAAMTGERRAALLAAVDALPSKLRDAIVCRHLLELSESETADVLGLPAGTVKSRLSRGLDRLRAALDEEVDRD
jgi:RNA polymerase sigma-70 factor (ECF subfamily)